MKMTLASVETDSMARADELLSLIKSPTAVATGVLLVFAKSQLDKGNNVHRSSDARWAVLASAISTLITVSIVAIMWPLAWRVMLSNAGNGIETRLVVYVFTFVVALATSIYSATVFLDAESSWRVAREKEEADRLGETKEKQRQQKIDAADAAAAAELDKDA